jgi:hypothetical protein
VIRSSSKRTPPICLVVESRSIPISRSRSTATGILQRIGPGPVITLCVQHAPRCSFAEIANRPQLGGPSSLFLLSSIAGSILFCLVRFLEGLAGSAQEEVVDQRSHANAEGKSQDETRDAGGNCEIEIREPAPPILRVVGAQALRPILKASLEPTRGKPRAASNQAHQ